MRPNRLVLRSNDQIWALIELKLKAWITIKQNVPRQRVGASLAEVCLSIIGTSWNPANSSSIHWHYSYVQFGTRKLDTLILSIDSIVVEPGRNDRIGKVSKLGELHFHAAIDATKRNRHIEAILSYRDRNCILNHWLYLQNLKTKNVCSHEDLVGLLEFKVSPPNKLAIQFSCIDITKQQLLVVVHKEISLPRPTTKTHFKRKHRTQEIGRIDTCICTMQGSLHSLYRALQMRLISLL